MLPNSEALGNLRGEGVHISLGQLFKSVHLQARQSISELVANTWNMLSFENNIVNKWGEVSEQTLIYPYKTVC